MKDPILTRLGAALSKHNARVSQEKQNAENEKARSAQEAIEFHRLVADVIKPALGEVARTANAAGFRCDVGDGASLEILFTFQDADHNFKMNNGSPPALSFRRERGAVAVTRKGRSGQGEIAPISFKNLTPEIIQKHAVRFVEAELSFAAEKGYLG